MGENEGYFVGLVDGLLLVGDREGNDVRGERVGDDIVGDLLGLLVSCGLLGLRVGAITGREVGPLVTASVGLTETGC